MESVNITKTAKKTKNRMRNPIFIWFLRLYLPMADMALVVLRAFEN